MMRVAGVGHTGLSLFVAGYVYGTVAQMLRGHEPRTVVGVCCLADGADQIFAQAVLDHGGALQVVIPAAGFRNTLPPESRDRYDRMLARAAHVHELGYPEPGPQAYRAAGLTVVNWAERLVAVWDGKPGPSEGGTADIVEHALRRGLPMDVIWPPGISRDDPLPSGPGGW